MPCSITAFLGNFINTNLQFFTSVPVLLLHPVCHCVPGWKQNIESDFSKTKAFGIQTETNGYWFSKIDPFTTQAKKQNITRTQMTLCVPSNQSPSDLQKDNCSPFVTTLVSFRVLPHKHPLINTIIYFAFQRSL